LLNGGQVRCGVQTPWKYLHETRRRKMKTLMTLIRSEEGATALEYGLIAALIAAGIVTAVSTLGTTVSNTFTNIANSMTGAAAGS
jgi:pilus assembly protein Flp/PilA